jgi:hypothetical protein
MPFVLTEKPGAPKRYASTVGGACRLHAEKENSDTDHRPTAVAFGFHEAQIGERNLHVAELTVGLFNLMNRLLEGHGVKGRDGLYRDLGAALARDGYAPLLAYLPDAGEADG